MQGGVPSHLIKLGVSTSSPVSWKRITGQLSFAPPSEDPERINVTAYGDPRQKFISGLPGTSEMVVRTLCDMDPSTNQWIDDVIDLRNSQNNAWWRFEIPVDRSGTNYVAAVFSGRVTAASIVAGDPNSRIEFEFRVEWDSGDFLPQLTPGPSQIP